MYLGRGGPAVDASESRGRRAARDTDGADVPFPLEAAFLLLKTVRAWRALLPAYWDAWRGRIVLCDRHPIEVLAVRPRRTPAGAALERFLARRLTPWPDAIVLLDAPAAVLYARKAEHDRGRLEAWRLGYAESFAGLAEVVRTDVAPEATLAEASRAVWRALARRRRWPADAG